MTLLINEINENNEKMKASCIAFFERGTVSVQSTAHQEQAACQEKFDDKIPLKEAVIDEVTQNVCATSPRDVPPSDSLRREEIVGDTSASCWTTQGDR